MASVVLSRHEAEQGELPDVCVQCGEAAVCKRSKLFSWSPHSLFPWVLFGGLLFLIDSVVAEHRMRVKLPFCGRHAGGWGRRNLFLWGGFLVVLLAFGLVVAASDAHMLPSGVEGGVLILALVWIILVAWSGRGLIRSEEVRSKTITLQRVSPAFVQAMTEFRLSHPDVASPARAASIFPKLIVPGLILLGVVFLIGFTAVSFLKSLPEGGSPGPRFAAPATVVHNEEHGFRLALPDGRGWRLLNRAELSRAKYPGIAGAAHPDGRCGTVLVDDMQPAWQIAGREQETARRLTAELNLRNQSEPVVEPLRVDGQSAVRFRFTGTDSDGKVLLLEDTVFVREGKLYQLMIFGLKSKTSADGASFRPFTDAFHLEP